MPTSKEDIYEMFGIPRPESKKDADNNKATDDSNSDSYDIKGDDESVPFQVRQDEVVDSIKKTPEAATGKKLKNSLDAIDGLDSPPEVQEKADTKTIVSGIVKNNTENFEEHKEVITEKQPSPPVDIDKTEVITEKQPSHPVDKTQEIITEKQVTLPEGIDEDEEDESEDEEVEKEAEPNPYDGDNKIELTTVGVREWSFQSPAPKYDKFYQTKMELVKEICPYGLFNFAKIRSELISSSVDVSVPVFEASVIHAKMQTIQMYRDRLKEMQIKLNAQYFLWSRAIVLLRGVLSRIEREKPESRQQGVIYEHMR
jgi:hypothetical protein